MPWKKFGNGAKEKPSASAQSSSGTSHAHPTGTDPPRRLHNHSRPYGRETTFHEEANPNSAAYAAYGQHEKMAQMQRQRHIEATKEMLFRVYGNVIATLEEYENRRTPKLPMTKSEIAFPDQSWKSLEDVKDNVEVQLALFETHRKSGLSDITKEVNDELRKKTISWAAARGEMAMDETDEYITHLYEILVKGKRIIKCMTNPGARRIYRVKSSLQHDLDEDVPGFLGFT